MGVAFIFPDSSLVEAHAILDPHLARLPVVLEVRQRQRRVVRSAGISTACLMRPGSESGESTPANWGVQLVEAPQ